MLWLLMTFHLPNFFPPLLLIWIAAIPDGSFCLGFSNTFSHFFYYDYPINSNKLDLWICKRSAKPYRSCYGINISTNKEMHV